MAARTRGDADGMRHWWGELVIDFFDRMDGFVATAHKGRLDDEEHDLAVAMSMARFATNLMGTFDGVSIGQLVNACKTLASHICMDVQRASVRRNDHEGPSLDDGWNADGDDRLVPVWEADEAAWRFERGEHGAEIRDFLGWALPQLGEDQRRVLAMTFEGDPVPEIVDTLGITAANAYQLRSRGFKELARLKERYDA